LEKHEGELARELNTTRTETIIPMFSNMQFAAPVAPRTGKINKNDLRVFERRKHLLQNGTLHFAFKLSQSSEISKLEFRQMKNGLF